MLRIYLLSFLLHFTHSRVNKYLKISCGLEEVLRDSVAMRFYIQLDNKDVQWSNQVRSSVYITLRYDSRIDTEYLIKERLLRQDLSHDFPTHSHEEYHEGKDCKVECIPDRCCLDQGNEENCDVLQLFGGCLETVPAGESRTVRLAAPLLDPFERKGYCVVHLHSKLKGHRIYRDTVTIPFDTGNPSHVKPCPEVDQDPHNDCQPVNCDTYYNGNKPHFSKRLKRCIETPPCSDDEVYDEALNKCARSVTEEDIQSLSNRKLRRAVKNITSRTAGEDSEQELFDIAQRVLDNYKAANLPLRCTDYLRSPKVLFCVICAQCGLVLTLVYYVRNRCKCVSVSNKRKEVLNRFFNFRQDDSITTPLLSVSHGTATTCEFHSDSSSNIDRKIQFYKACRKDKQAKASMSDDILSRCLKRRDWITKPKSSEVIPESKEKEERGIQVYETEHVSDRTGKSNKKRRVMPGPVESLPLQISSEKQMKSFEYEDQNVCNPQTYSLAENCAQACFSKDSIDDFLSERGLLSISGSSKTSKDNVVLALMSHKPGPASDPGVVSEDLELLHMSRMSFSSSDYGLKRTAESRSSL